MPIYSVKAPDGQIYDIRGPENATEDQILAAARAEYLRSRPAPKEETTGFTAAASAGLSRLKGDIALLGGKLGVMRPEEAEAYQKAREEEARKRFTGSEWSEAPGTKIAELFGGSVPYMAAPLVAGAAAASAPVSGALGLGTLAAGALGAGAVSAAQFTGSNLAEQMKTGKRLEETSGGAAVAAAIPQALLDVGAQLLMPGIGRMLGRAGAKVTEESAAKLAQQTFLQKAGDYALRTGRAGTVEGTTEAAQEVLAKLQAGQNLTDPEARADYIENFLGGLAMGTVLGPFGRAADRGRIIREGRALTAAREGREAEERRVQELAAAPQQLTELEAAQEQLRAQLAQTADPAEIQSLGQQGIAQAKEIKRLRELLSMPPSETEIAAAVDPETQKRIQKLQTQLVNAQRQGNFAAATKLLGKLNELQASPISPLEDQGAPGEVAPEVAAPAPFTAPAAEAPKAPAALPAVAPDVAEEVAPSEEAVATPTVRTRRPKKGTAPAVEPAVVEPAAETPAAETPVVEPPAQPVAEPSVEDLGVPTTPPAAIEQGVLFTEPRAPKLTPQREQAIQFWEEQNDGRDLHIPFDRLSPKRQASWIRDTELGRASPDTHARAVRLQLEEDRKYGPAGPKVSSEFGGPAFEPATAPARVKGIENLLGMALRSNKLDAADRQVADQIEANLPDILRHTPETRETPMVGGPPAKVTIDLKNDVYTWLRDTLSGRDRTDLGANIVAELRGINAGVRSEFLPKIQYESTKLTPEQADFLKGTEQELSTPTPPTEPRTTGELTGRTGRTVAMERQAAEEGRTTPMPKVVPGGREVVQGELFAAPERETAFSTAKEFKDYLAGDALSDLRKAQLGDKVPPTAARVQKDLAPLKEELGKLEGVLSGLAAQKRLIEAGGAAAEQRLAGQRAALSQRRNTLEEGILGRVRRLVAQEKAVADQINAAQAESARINRWVEQNARIFEMKFAGAAPDTAIEEYLVEDAKLEDQIAAWEEHANELAGIRKDALGRIDKWLNTPKNKPVVTALREEIANIDTQMAALDKTRAEQAARTTQEVSAAREFLRAPQRRASELREKIGKAEGAVSERARTAAQAANVAQEKQAEETLEKVKAARRQETERFEKAKGLREQLPGQRVDAKKAREVLNRMDDLVATATSSRQEAFDRASARKELSEEFGDKDAAALMAAWSKATRPTTEEQAEIDAAKQADAEAKPQDKAAAKDRLKALNNTIGKRMDASLAEYETLKRRIIEVYYAPKGQKAAAGVAKHTSALKEQQAQLATIEQELESKVNAESGKKLNSRQVAAREKKKAALGEAIAETEVKLAKSTAKRAKARNIKIEQLTPTKASPAAVRAAMNTLSPDEYQAIKAAPDYETFVDQNPDLKVNKTVFNIAKTQIGREAAPLVRKGTTAGVIRGVSEEQRTAGAAAKIVKGEVAGLTAGPAQAPDKGKTVSKVQQARAATGKRAVTKKDIAEANKLADEWKRLAEGVQEGEAERAAAAEGTEWQGFGGQTVAIEDVDDYLDSLPDARLTEGYASRATQDLDADTAAALERGETVAALESLAQNGSTDFVRTLAQRLRDVIGDTTKVKLVDGLEVDGQAAEGLYDAAKRLIELDRNSMTEETLTHEATHAATVQTLDAYEKEKAGAGGMQMTRRQFLKGAAAAVGSMQLPKIPLSTSVEQRMQLFTAAQKAFNSWMSSAAKLLPLSDMERLDFAGSGVDYVIDAAYKNDKALGGFFDLEERGGFVDEYHYDGALGKLLEDPKALERVYKTFYDARQTVVDSISKQTAAEKPFQLTAEQRRAAEELDKLYQSMRKKAGVEGRRAGEKLASAQRGKPVFYSALTRAVENSPASSAPPAGWSAFLKGLINKGQVKAEEIEWSGVNDWLALQQGKVSKDALTEYLRGNGVQVEEVVRDSTSPDERSKFAQFSEYVLAGGKNYREVLLTLAPSRAQRPFVEQEEAARAAYLRALKAGDTKEMVRLNAEIERLEGAHGMHQNKHWTQKNVLAHIRVNDRTDAAGNKVLFVEEIQSDWGQEGKRSGFAEAPADVRAELIGESKYFPGQSEYEMYINGAKVGTRHAATANEAIARARESLPLLIAAAPAIKVGLTPRAPFVTKTEGWLNLALKHVMQMAVEGGYDKVAFINGEQAHQRFPEKQNGESTEKAFKAFYDSIVPNAVRALTKKLGGQVETVEMELGKPSRELKRSMLFLDWMASKHPEVKRVDAARAWSMGIDNNSFVQEYHDSIKRMSQSGFDITPVMREKVGEGLPLFSRQRKVAPDLAGLADEYGLTNLKEFAAEVMSNKDFRARLDQTEGLLKRIYNAFLRLIGFDPKTVSEMAVDNVYKLFAPNTSTSNTERMASLVRGTFFNTGPKFAAGTPESVMNAANDIVGRRAGLGDRAVAAASGLLWRTKTVDRWAPAELLIKQGVAKGKLTEAQALQTRINMRMLEQRSQLVGTAVVDGVPQLSTADKYGGIRLVEGREGANLRKMLDALKDSGVGDSRATEEMFSAWMAVLRSENEGIGLAKLNYDLDPAKAATIKAYVDANPKIRNAFEKARAIYKEYNRDLLTLLVDTGVMERSKMEQLLEGDFVPYYRVDNKTGMVRLELGPTKTFDIGNVLRQPELKELVGGDQKILPIFDGAVRNTAMLIGMATKNLQTREVAFMLKQLGLGEIRKGEGPEFSPRFKVDGALKHIAIDPDAFPEGIPAALLIEGLQGIQAAMPGIVKLMGVPAQFLRRWVMRTPLYPLRQVIRDSAHAWLTTGGNFTPVLSSFAEFGRMVTGTSNVEQILQRSGVISSNVYTGDTGDYVKLLRDMKTTSTFGMALAKLDAIAQQGDAATRAVVYDSFRKQGMSHPEALLNTLESMNFSRRGTSSSLHWLSSMIPFFHSSLQGLDAVYRSFKGDTSFEGKMNARSSLLKRGLLLSGMTIAYAAMMQDDEAYRNATPDQRLMNWFIRVPGLDEPIRVPIPFELGLIFKSIPETIINVAFGDTKAKDALKALGQQALRSLPGGEAPIPTAIKPVLEVAMNHSLFSDQPVESMRERGMDVSARYRVNTTGLAKALGQFGVLSPVQIEHLIRGYTGNLFLHMSSVVDVLMRPTMPDAAKQPARNLSELPLIGGMFQPNTARGVIDATFKEVEKSQQAKRTYDQLLVDGKDDEAEKYANQFAMRIALNSTGGMYRQQMGEFAKQRRAIAASDATPEEKRQQLNDLKKVEIEYSQSIKEIFSEAE
jgi:hypothetical protein